MKAKQIYIFFFSLFFVLGFSQEVKKENAPTEKWSYKPNFMVGFDILNLTTSFFSERKVYQGFISSKVTKNIHAVVDAGFEKNIYVKNGYDAKASGAFLKLGVIYMLAKDPENEFNGFYAGGKLAGSFYKQEYFAVPIRGFGGSSSSVSFPSSSQSSYWIEGSIGGRVQLFETPFYIDVNLQPKYLAYSTTQEDIKPMIVPGFGKSSNKFNLGFAWSLAYMF